MKKLYALALGVLMTLGLSSTALADEPRCETITVVDEEAWTEVIPGTPSQHYSYVGGPIEGTPAPPPAEGWQANTTIEPHYQGQATPAQQPDGDPYTDGESGLHYVSHGSSGLADWFYFDPGTPDETIEHEAVTHTERDCDKPDKPDKPEKPEPPVVDKPHRGDLAMTGMSAGWAAILATVLAGLGGGALWLSRRRMA